MEQISASGHEMKIVIYTPGFAETLPDVFCVFKPDHYQRHSTSHFFKTLDTFRSKSHRFSVKKRNFPNQHDKYYHIQNFEGGKHFQCKFTFAVIERKTLPVNIFDVRSIMIFQKPELAKNKFFLPMEHVRVRAFCRKKLPSNQCSYAWLNIDIPRICIQDPVFPCHWFIKCRSVVSNTIY